MTDKFTVYLVDDDAGVLKALSRLLRAKDYEVEAYSSPQEFLDEHDAAVPGCAVLDVAMPGLDGLELQQALTARRLSSPGHIHDRKGRYSDQRARHEGRRDRFPDQAGQGHGFVRSASPR